MNFDEQVKKFQELEQQPEFNPMLHADSLQEKLLSGPHVWIVIIASIIVGAWIIEIATASFLSIIFTTVCSLIWAAITLFLVDRESKKMTLQLENKRNIWLESRLSEHGISLEQFIEKYQKMQEEDAVVVRQNQTIERREQEAPEDH